MHILQSLIVKGLCHAFVVILLSILLLHCDSPNPSNATARPEIRLEVSAPSGEGRTPNQYYIGEPIQSCIEVLEPSALDSLQVQYKVIRSGSASYQLDRPADSSVAGEHVSQSHCFSVEVTHPCTLAIIAIAGGPGGVSRDSVRVQVAQEFGKNAPPTIETKVLCPSCSPPRTCTVSVVVSNPESWQTVQLSIAPKLEGTRLIGDSLFLWTPADTVAPGRQTIVFSVTDDGNPFRSATASVDLKVARKTFQIVYHANGANPGTEPVDAIQYESKDTATVKAKPADMNQEGYVFANWNSTPEGNDISYSPGDDIAVINSDIHLYAQWEPAPRYTITYHGNQHTGGDTPTDTNAYLTGTSVTIADEGTLKKNGYVFRGWNTAEDGGDTSYSAESGLTIQDSDVDLYAIWKERTYTITYHSTGAISGTPPPDIGQYKKDSTTVISENNGALVRVGYTFAGWKTVENGYGLIHAPGEKIKVATDLSFYPAWRRTLCDSLEIKVNAPNGGAQYQFPF